MFGFFRAGSDPNKAERIELGGEARCLDGSPAGALVPRTSGSFVYVSIYVDIFVNSFMIHMCI